MSPTLQQLELKYLKSMGLSFDWSLSLFAWKCGKIRSSKPNDLEASSRTTSCLCQISEIRKSLSFFGVQRKTPMRKSKTSLFLFLSSRVMMTKSSGFWKHIRPSVCPRIISIYWNPWSNFSHQSALFMPSSTTHNGVSGVLLLMPLVFFSSLLPTFSSLEKNARSVRPTLPIQFSVVTAKSSWNFGLIFPLSAVVRTVSFFLWY